MLVIAGALRGFAPRLLAGVRSARRGRGGARVVVRLGRPRTAFLNFLPSRPPLGSVIADTGYAAGGLGRDTVARIAAGRVSGTLDATPPGRTCPAGCARC